MKILERFTFWIYGWVDMLCGLLEVLTLTLYRPNWDMTIRMLVYKKLIKLKKPKHY